MSASDAADPVVRRPPRRGAALALLLCLGAAPPVPAPAAITVPAALLARTTMPEASGVLWVASLQRYLLISDDTGDKAQGTNHAPWLFTLRPDGHLDPEVLTIEGIQQLNDAEAICQGPAGTFFLATSHSRNRKGQERSERRQLLQLALSGRSLRVQSTLELIGMPEGLDIEGLDYHQGALYLGLKAPLSAGGAQIMRVPDVDQALRTARPGQTIPLGGIARFAEVPLRVPGPSGLVSEGISDLRFLPDGSLVLLANSPKGAPPDGGGALWWLRPGGQPRLLRRFPGLKPEGVTLDGAGRELVIVFDRDREPPQWVVAPLPR